MPNSSKAQPLALIVGAIVIAGGLAVYLSRESAAPNPNAGVGATAAVSTTGASTGRVRGAADAKITLIEYGDYQCPTCGHYHPILAELLKRYEGSLKLEYHHVPLIQIHPNAMGAALAAESASDQGKFWEMHDMLYEHQNDWAPSPNAEALFLQYALQLGLDSNQFMQSLKNPATRDRVLADVTRGSAFVQGTPTFILNGDLLTDLPDLKAFSELIERHLAK